MNHLRAILDYFDRAYPSGGTKLELYAALYVLALFRGFNRAPYNTILSLVLRAFHVNIALYSPRCSIYAWTLLDTGSTTNAIVIDLVDPFSMERIGNSALVHGVGGSATI